MPYLPQTMQSIAEQTYRNQKIIAWDNGSNDGSKEELHRWIPHRIPGVVVANNPLRLGPSLAAMVEMADTELCVRMDGDDINVLDRLERQVAFMQSHREVGVLGGQLDLIDEHNRPIIHEKWTYQTSDASVRWLLRWRNQLAHNAVIFRRSIVLAAGNYRDKQPFEDLDLWQRASYRTEICNLPDVLVFYRRIQSSSTGTIKDFLPTDRAAAELNATILFPGLERPGLALSLWEATHPYQLHLPSKFRHIKELQRAALLFSQRAGKPANYFTSTDTYQEQYMRLRHRFFRRVGLMPLVRAREHMRGFTARADLLRSRS